MKETKSYWYHNTAYSREPYSVCLDFPNLLTRYAIIKTTSDGGHTTPQLHHTSGLWSL